MLQIFREKAQGIMAWVIVLLIGAVFVFFGLGDYFSSGNNRTTAAKINGQKISWAAVENLYERVSRQYAGQPIDQKALKEQILMTMVQRTALLLKAKDLGFRVGEEQVAEFLLQIPAFQVDGTFSKERYLQVLKQADYTDVGFRQELSQDVLLGQLEQGLIHSSFTLDSELQNSIALLDQKRNFGYMLIPAQKYKKDIHISEAEIKSHYEKHQSSFIKPEQVVLEYVELSLEQLAKQIKPSKEEVLAFYQENQAAYTTPERVHARHILIMAPQDDEALSKKAKEKADALLAELKQKTDFETLAKKVSEDVGSAEQGGDLGWFVRGQMVPEFEKAAFELKQPGSIAGPVRTQFGYHIIQLIEHKDSEARSFNEVQNFVEEQLKRGKAEALFAEKKEAITKLALEQTTTLMPIAEQFNLKIRETEPFSRQGGKEGAITTHPEVIKAAFSEALLKQGHNSEPIKLSDKVIGIFRLKKHEPAVQETLAQAEPRIKEQLVAEATKIKIKGKGEAILEALKNGKNASQVANNEQLTWVEKVEMTRMPSPEMDRHIVTAAFQMSPNEPKVKQPSVKGLWLPNGDYLVLVLNKIQLGDIKKVDLPTQDSYRQGLAQVTSQLEYALYANQVLRDAKVEITKDPS